MPPSGLGVPVLTSHAVEVAQQAAGGVGAALAFAANLYYIRLIRQDKATPHPVTWVVWAFIGALGAYSAAAGGAGAGALVPTAYLSVYGLIAYFALRRQLVRRKSALSTVSRRDIGAGLVAVVLALAWRFAELGPGWLAALAVVADFFALWPTLEGAWHEPSTRGERAVWSVDTVAALIGLAAVTWPWHGAAVAFPAYLFLANGAVAVVMWSRRHALATAGDSTDPCDSTQAMPAVPTSSMGSFWLPVDSQVGS